MISRYKYYERVSDDYLGSHPGVIDLKSLQGSFLSNTDPYYTIPLRFQFRPDLISQYFYGTTSLQWLITFINNIGDSPEGYYVNRIIRIPDKEKVRSLL